MLHAARFAVRTAARFANRSTPRQTFSTRCTRRSGGVAARLRTRKPELRRVQRSRRGGPRLFDPADAVERLHGSFRAVARRIAPRDAWLREDLAQEMALAVLALKRPRTLARFRTWAAWRARDYARRFGGPRKRRAGL